MEQNIVEDLVIPEVPKVIPNQEMYVYVPAATYENKGIANFDSNTLTVSNGKVSVKISFVDGKIDDRIVQVIGQNLDKVISQKAMTDLLEEKASKNELESVTISSSEPTKKVINDIWVNFDGEVRVYNGSEWVLKLNMVTSNELTNELEIIRSLLNNKASVSNIVDINNKIPPQASINNKLADKAFVNSSIATATATFQGTYTDIADLPTEGVDLNDYAFVSGVEDGNAYYDRYKYTGSEWKKEYRLNNSSFTAEQWAAINSGITNGKIAEIDSLILGLSTSKADKDSVYTKNETLIIIDDEISQGLDALGAEQVVNKTTAIYADSTDTQYPSAKAVYTLTNGIDKKVDENTKDINSLKAIVSNTVVTDTEVSDKYYTRKTADSLSVIDGAQTRVNKISGNTISSKNLIPYPYAFTTSTSGGLNYTVNANGSITVNGTTAAAYSGVVFKRIYLPAGTYTISGYNGNIIVTARKYNNSTGKYDSWIDSKANRDQTGTLTEYTKVEVQLFYEIGTGVSINTTVYPMLNEGSTVLPYYQYFSGLKNAGFKSILSTGKNLVNTDGLFRVGKVYNGLTCSQNADGTYKLSGTATNYECYGVKIPCIIPKGSTIYFTPFYNITTSAEADTKYKVIGLVLYDKDNKFVQQWNSNIYSGVTATHNTIALKDIAKVGFVWRIEGATGLPVTIDNIKFMLSYENTNVYEPYKSDGIACASNLELAEFDYAVPSENKVYRQSETITFDGTESGWQVDDSHGYSNMFRYVGYASDKIPFTDPSSVNAISNKYPSARRSESWANKSSFVTSSFINRITIRDTSVSTLAEFKEKLVAWASEGKPLTVTYKKQSTVTEDVLFDKADYTAYLNGSESVMQGDNNTGDYGEECTVDQNYYVKNEV